MNTVERALDKLERAEKKKPTALAALGKTAVNDGEQVDVPLGSLEVIPVLFQNRTDVGRDGTNRDHVAGLTRDLPAAGRFTPMTVIEVGAKLVVVEGHHRLATYRKCLQADASVPVVVRRWTVREALAKAGSDNVRTHLPMSPRERGEYAWRLVRMAERGLIAGMSKDETARQAGVAARTVATMRSTAKKIEEARGADLSREDLAPYRMLSLEMEWAQVVNALSNRRQADQEVETEEMLDAKADALWLEIEKRTHLWHYLKRAPDVFLRALHRNAPGSLEHLGEAMRDFIPPEDGPEEDEAE